MDLLVKNLPDIPEGYEDAIEWRIVEIEDYYWETTSGRWALRMHANPYLRYYFCIRPKALKGIDWLNQRKPGDVWKWEGEVYAANMGYNGKRTGIFCLTKTNECSWVDSDSNWDYLSLTFPNGIDNLSDKTVEWLNHG